MAQEQWNVQYDTSYSFDLNNDNIQDAVVVLNQQCGGTGMFIFLVPVVNKDGSGHSMKPFELNDRDCVQNITASKGIVTVSYLTHKEDEDLSETGTKEVTLKLKLKGDEFVEIK